MNQSQFLAITCNSLKAREKSRVHGAIGFGFASHWLKNCRESFEPVTKRSNRNRVITFDSHLKIEVLISLPLSISNQISQSSRRYIISNGNRTEWGTIQGVIGRVILNQLGT